MLLVGGNFKDTFTKNMSVFSLFTSNNATSLGDSLMWGALFVGALFAEHAEHA